MNVFSKSTLAIAFASVPFAQADLAPLDDSVLETMTGKTGVTIEASINLSVGSFVYTDTDGYMPSPLFEIEDAAGTAATAGTFSMNNIVLGGNGGGALDDIKIEIDADGSDALIIHLGSTYIAEMFSGTDMDFDTSIEAIDFGLSIGSVDVNSTTLASNISFNGNLGPIDIVIDSSGEITLMPSLR